jgi:hypothetical protein
VNAAEIEMRDEQGNSIPQVVQFTLKFVRSQWLVVASFKSGEPILIRFRTAIPLSGMNRRRMAAMHPFVDEMRAMKLPLRSHKPPIGCLRPSSTLLYLYGE